MTTRYNGRIHALLVGLSLGWPLQVYGYVPYIDATFTAVLTIALLILMVYRWREHAVRAPLEYWWPLLAALVCCIIGGAPWTIAPAMVAFLLAVQFVCSREQIEQLMFWSVVAIGIVAATNGVAGNLGLAPTAYSMSTGITFRGTHTVPDGFLLLIVGLMWGIYLTLKSTLSPAQRSATFFASFFCLGILAGKIFLLRNNAYDWSEAPLLSSNYPSIIGWCLFAWLCCRVVAKLWVREDDSTLAAVLSTTVVVLLILSVATSLEIGLRHGWVLGLIAGYALPDREAYSRRKYPIFLPAIASVLFVLNTITVFPLNDFDARNLDRSARQDWDDKNYVLLHRRAENLLNVYPKQSDSLYAWMAMASIQLGHYDRASKELALAGAAYGVGESERSLTANMDRALTDLRDLIAALPNPEESFAYERALVGLGKRGSALVLLKLKIESGVTNLPVSWTRDVKAFFYAGLVGDNKLAPEIEQWEELDRTVDRAPWSRVVVDPPVGGSVDGEFAWMVDRWPHEIRVYVMQDDSAWVSSRSIERDWIKSVEASRMDSPMVLHRADTNDEEPYFGIFKGDESDAPLVTLQPSTSGLLRIELPDADYDGVPFGPTVHSHEAP